MQFINLLQKITLYIFFFSINFEMLRLFPENEAFSTSRLTGILYFLAVIPLYKLYFQTDNIKRFLVPVFVFFGLQTFMSLININEVSSTVIDTSLLLNIIFFWIIINHERMEHLIVEKAMLSFAFGAVVLTLFYYAGFGIEYEEGRLSIFGDDQNYIGFRTAVAILILITTVLQNRLKMGWSRYLFLIPIPFMLKLISETGSRGAFFSIALSVGAGIVLYRTKNFRKKVVTVVVGILLFIATGTYLLESETMKSRLKETTESGDTGGRAKIWRNVFEIVKENPVLGVGKTGYALATTVTLGEVESAHNVILEVLCYTGIVGFIIYFTFFYRIGISSYQVYQHTSLLLPILLMIPVMGMILSIQILTKKIGWIIFAYIVSTLAVKHEDLKVNHK